MAADDVTPAAEDVAACVEGELRLLDPALRRSPAAAALLDPDFRELGSSGRGWDRAGIVAMRAQDEEEPPQVHDIESTALVPDVVLVTYRTGRPGRSTPRSSIWRRRDGRWLVVFHQGTVV